MPRGVYERQPRESIEEARESPMRRSLLEMTPEEMEIFLENQLRSNVLPNPPQIPGVHWLWASTTNTQTPIAFYLNLGYTFATHQDVQGMMSVQRQHSAEYGEYVTHNEMILLKCPEEAYKKIMDYFHRIKPDDEARRLRSAIERVKHEVGTDASGRPLVMEAEDEERRGRIY